MFIAILVIVLLAAGVFCYFLVKKERKKQLERRAAKVKIAEGNFEDLPEAPPVKKKKVRKGKKPGKDWVPPLPDYIVKDLEKGLPGLIERAFEQSKTVHETAAAMKASSAKLGRAKAKMYSHIFPVDQPAAALSSWMAYSHSARCAVEELSVEHCAVSNTFQRANSALRGSYDQMAKHLKSIENYDLSDVDPELMDLIEIVRALKSELPLQYKVESEDLTLAPEYDVRRQCQDLLTRDLVEIFENELGRTFPRLTQLMQTRSATTEAAEALKQELKSAVLVEPEKPTDADVAKFLEQVETWSTKVQKARATLERRLEEMEEAVRLYDEIMVDTKLAWEQANDIALDGGKHLASAALQRCNIAYKQLEVVQTDSAKALADATAILDSDLSILDEEETEGEAASETATQAEVDQPSEADATAALRTAMRKLGFAVAQKCAAQGKLNAAAAQGIPAASQFEPNLEEVSGESYLRRFNQWQKAIAEQNAAGEARKERLASLTEQVNQRAEQVPQAATILVEKLQQAAALPVIGQELMVLARAAAYLCERYEPPQQAATAPAQKAPAQAPAKAAIKPPLPPPPPMLAVSF